MAIKYLVVTNNSKVKEDKGQKHQIEYLDYDPSLGYRPVLEKARELVHTGKYKLETHPLSGSVKPNETPYKSIVLSLHKNKPFDTSGTMILEDSLATFDKFRTNSPIPSYPEEILEDFKDVDNSLISEALSRMPY